MTGANIIYSVSGHLGGPISALLAWGVYWGVGVGGRFFPTPVSPDVSTNYHSVYTPQCPSLRILLVPFSGRPGVAGRPRTLRPVQ